MEESDKRNDMEEKDKKEKGKESNAHDRIEIRSEKVRQILGEVPDRLVRWGTAVICIIFAIIIAVVLCVRYPYGNGETIFEHIFL